MIPWWCVILIAAWAAAFAFMIVVINSQDPEPTDSHVMPGDGP